MTYWLNILVWALQILAALIYTASGVMKAFTFEKASQGVASFGALPRNAWFALGLVELACVIGLIVPGVLGLPSQITVVAAAILAVESLVFIWVHVKYREVPAIVMSATLGLVMAFVAVGRFVLALRF